MRSTLACLVVLGGVVAATTASAQDGAPATGTDVYHVHFAKAAPGQAAALGKDLMEPDKTSPMPTHFIVLRHQEGDDWDYVVIQHLGPKAEVTSSTPPPTDAQRALNADPNVEALIRRSSLRTSDDQPVSRNLVVALCHQDEALGPVFTGRESPIGRGLGAQGLARARRILGTGEADWLDSDGARRPCAFKAYVLERAGQPLAYLHERFNPEFVPLDG